jgi:hypothetical protein
MQIKICTAGLLAVVKEKETDLLRPCTISIRSSCVCLRVRELCARLAPFHGGMLHVMHRYLVFFSHVLLACFCVLSSLLEEHDIFVKIVHLLFQGMTYAVIGFTLYVWPRSIQRKEKK